MSLKQQRSIKSYSFWGRFKKKELVPKKYDTKKIVKLTNIMKKDANSLGITNLSFEFNDGSTDVYTHSSVMTEGDKIIWMPATLNIEYNLIEKLTTDEIRRIMWHEFGHHIFSVYYPKIKMATDPASEVVEEAFCDELAYMRFGPAYILAYIKATKFSSMLTKKKNKYEYDVNRLFPLMEYVNVNGIGYWRHLAEDLGVEVKYNPRAINVLGVKPNRAILNGLIK